MFKIGFVRDNEVEKRVMKFRNSGCTFPNAFILRVISCCSSIFLFWFYLFGFPFWFFEFSVVIRFIVDDSIVWSLRFSCVLPPINNIPEVYSLRSTTSHLFLYSSLRYHCWVRNKNYFLPVSAKRAAGYRLKI